MTFSSEIKKELCSHFGNGRHCSIAEIAGIINTCGLVGLSPPFIKIHSENAFVAKKYFTLVKQTFNFSSEVSIKNNKQLKKNRIYSVIINNKEAEKILRATGLLKDESSGPLLTLGIPKLVIKSSCCKRAYLRGTFISGGSLCHPEKNYHLELVNQSASLCNELSDLINTFDINSKVIKRKDNFVVYIKDGEKIVDFLNVIEAHYSLMNMENVRILKDMRNNVNRMVNCETANLNKTVTAAVRQIEDIRLIEQTKGLSSLSEALEEIAALRLSFPDASLKEIGSLLTPPVGKSGVNHRLRKLSEIADNIRGGFLNDRVYNEGE